MAPSLTNFTGQSVGQQVDSKINNVFFKVDRNINWVKNMVSIFNPAKTQSPIDTAIPQTYSPIKAIALVGAIFILAVYLLRLRK